MILYIIGDNGYFSGTMPWPDDPEEINGIPYGTTRREVPEIPEGMYAVWMGSGWYLTPIPPPPEEIIIEGDINNDQSANSDTNVQ